MYSSHAGPRSPIQPRALHLSVRSNIRQLLPPAQLSCTMATTKKARTQPPYELLYWPYVPR